MGDLDSDGKFEIAAATTMGRVYVWDATGAWDPARAPWPMARHDLQRTGRYVSTEGTLGLSKKTASAVVANVGNRVTYTIELIRSGAPLASTILVTDTVPGTLSYVAGSLTATTGTANDSLMPVLTWSGALSAQARAVITYAVTVNVSTPQVVTNTATIDAGVAGRLTRNATVLANWKLLYLPLVRR